MDKLMGFIGRVIYAIPFLGFGLGHLTHAGAMAGMVPSFFPGGVFWIYFTGGAMILAALAIITGQKGREACLGLVVMLLIFILFIHLPGLSNPQMKMMAMANFFKDMGLMGGALVISTTFKKA